MGESVSAPRRVVLDAGPLIALLHGGDRYHASAVAGFQQLADAGGELITPLPIVFEVYKWILHESGPRSAREGLRQMRGALAFAFPDPEAFDAAATLSDSTRDWAGTLEDALVAVTALRMRIPVWTLNFRDLGAFSNLRFWTPGVGV